MRAAILTDFANHDAAYSLCGVVANQTKMLVGNGVLTKVLVREGFPESDAGAYHGAEVVQLDPGETGTNTVEVTDKSGAEIEHLTNQMRDALADANVVLAHDVIYQPNQWKHHVAARRLAKERPDLRWVHWVHSVTGMNVAAQTGAFAPELEGKFPNSVLVAFHDEEINRKGAMYGYEMDEVVVVPHPIDLTECYHPLALEVIGKAGLVEADVIGIFPCRLDRGKQPHFLIEIFAELNDMGWDARVVIVDFHSIHGGPKPGDEEFDKHPMHAIGWDKMVYRDEMKRLAAERHVPTTFTSDMDYAEADQHVDHKAVLDLMDYADVLVQPSIAEAFSLVVFEAMWKRCGLVLNFDLPRWREFQGRALLYKFSSGVDVTTGMLGETKTEYPDRRAYMKHIAGGIAYQMKNNPVLRNHALMRKEYSLQGVWRKHLWPVLEGESV